MFVLESLTKCRVLDVRVLSKKDRAPDEHPGAQLLLQATLGVSVLAMFDGFLPGMLYRKPAGKPQGELDGIESAELTEIGAHVKRMPWVYEQTGCTITIDLGIGGKSALTLGDVKVHRVSLRPDQKGVVIQWTADAPGLNDATRGKLTGLKSTDVQLTMVGPEVEDDAQQKIPDAKPEKAKAAAPAPAPKAQGPEEALAATSGTGEASKQALDASGKNPFGAAAAPADAPAGRSRKASGAVVE